MQDNQRSKTSPRNIGLQWILMPPTLTGYPAAALLTLGDPYLLGHTPSGPAVATGHIHQCHQPLVGCINCVLLHALHCADKTKMHKVCIHSTCADAYLYDAFRCARVQLCAFVCAIVVVCGRAPVSPSPDLHLSAG